MHETFKAIEMPQDIARQAHRKREEPRREPPNDPRKPPRKPPSRRKRPPVEAPPNEPGRGDPAPDKDTPAGDPPPQRGPKRLSSSADFSGNSQDEFNSLAAIHRFRGKDVHAMKNRKKPLSVGPSRAGENPNTNTRGEEFDLQRN
jgi:hypothetical protein